MSKPIRRDTKPRDLQQKVKNQNQKAERRISSAKFEIRMGTNGNGKKIAGYATKFTPAMSEDLGGFREQIDPHAFDACLAANPDVRALFNHSADHILGRTTAGTLRLSADRIGLQYEIDPPDTNLARDLMVSMERGDVTQSSFGFICLDDKWADGAQGIIRTVLKAELFDVSPVTFPAYPDATSGVRASLRSCPVNLRSKLKRKDDDSTCDPDSPDYDPDACDEEDRCDCECDECEDGYCDQCTNTDCDSDDCPNQQRKAHLDLLIRRLRS